MNKGKKEILLDIYSKSNKGLIPVSIGNNGFFLITDDANRKYIENLQELQNEGYIVGVGKGKPNPSGIMHYFLPQVNITKKGIDFIEKS